MKGFTIGYGKLLIRCASLLRWAHWGRVGDTGFMAGPMYHVWLMGPVTVMWERSWRVQWPVYDPAHDRWIGIVPGPGKIEPQAH